MIYLLCINHNKIVENLRIIDLHTSIFESKFWNWYIQKVYSTAFWYKLILTSSVTCVALSCNSWSSVLGAPFSAATGAGILLSKNKNTDQNFLPTKQVYKMFDISHKDHEFLVFSDTVHFVSLLFYIFPSNKQKSIKCTGAYWYGVFPNESRLQ